MDHIIWYKRDKKSCDSKLPRKVSFQSENLLLISALINGTEF